jgi:hypothetical protein
MDCEQALPLLVEQMDHEIQPDDQVRLNGHLQSCSACHATSVAMRLQDADLRRSFIPYRRAADDLAARVISQLPHADSRKSRTRVWFPILLAAAAGFLLAILVFRPWGKPQSANPDLAIKDRALPPREVSPLDMVGETILLAVTTGAVEIAEQGQEIWATIQPGSAIGIGKRIRTPEQSRCELRLTDGSEVRLNAGTELHFVDSRRFHVARGQILARTPTNTGKSLNIGVPDAMVSSSDGEFDLVCNPDESRLTVLRGDTTVEGKGEAAIVKKGERVRIAQGLVSERGPVYDMLRETRWINEILLRKGRDNKELTDRVNGLLAQLGESKMAFLSETEIRALGDHCVLPLTRFLQSADSTKGQLRSKRESAANIVGDLAQPWSIPDLIQLLKDENGEVRFHAARALQRLTQENQRIDANEWRRNGQAKSREAGQQKWLAWWTEHKHLFPAPP